MSIHTIGDSHSLDNWANIIPHYLGAVLAYSVGKDPLGRVNINDFNIKDGDTVIFCFGEIDCRCHVYKHISDKLSYQNIIDDIVINYINAVKIIVEKCNSKIKNVCVYNIVPPIRRKEELENKDWPFLGSDQERKNYVLYFNEQLRIKCKENNLIFFDIYDKYVDDEGFLKYELSDGNVHIKDHTYTTEFINSYLK